MVTAKHQSPFQDMSEPKPATSTQSSAPSSAQQEEEVYGTLGALLGTLEVVAADDAHPISPVQAERVESALRISYSLQHQIEALLTLSADDLGARLRRGHARVRPLLEHAVRGAARTFASHGVELRMPSGSAWGSEAVYIDLSRIDRTLRALTETLVAGAGAGSSIEVSVKQSGAVVTITLRSELSPERGKQAPPVGAALLARSAERLFGLHGGTCTLDLQQLMLVLTLPASEGPVSAVGRARE
jgi:hypothetical protein